jgi:hypothetical protein
MILCDDNFYVNDLIVTSNDFSLLKKTKDNLLNFFEMVDLNEIWYCLGIQINHVQQDRTIYLNQSKYIGSILKQFGMVENKSI